MTDMMIRHVDDVLVERVRALEKERNWSTNDVLLHALRYGLGLSAAHEYSEFARDPGALKELHADWADAERGVFNEAMQALARANPTQLSPESVRMASSSGAAG